VRQLHNCLVLRRHGRNFHRAGVQRAAVGLHHVTEAVGAGARKVLPVADNGAGPVISHGDAERFDDLLEIQQSRPRIPVGVHQAAGDKIAAVDFLPEVAAVAVVLDAMGDVIVMLCSSHSQTKPPMRRGYFSNSS
jgi:hypothetical protein